jgi:hypothetical protein
MAKKNDCSHFFDMICDAFEEDINSSFCSELEEHLRECQDCCAQIETMRQTVAFCRKLIDEDVPPNVDKVLWQMLGLEKP